MSNLDHRIQRAFELAFSLDESGDSETALAVIRTLIASDAISSWAWLQSFREAMQDATSPTELARLRDELAYAEGDKRRLEAQVASLMAELDRISPKRALSFYVPVDFERKIALIKLIRSITGMGLKDAKDLAETGINLGTTIKIAVPRDISPEELGSFRDQLNELGMVDISCTEPSPAPTLALS